MLLRNHREDGFYIMYGLIVKTNLKPTNELTQNFDRTLDEIVICDTILALPAEERDVILDLVQNFNYATPEDTHSYKEEIDYNGKTVCWNIDYSQCESNSMKPAKGVLNVWLSY